MFGVAWNCWAACALAALLLLGLQTAASADSKVKMFYDILNEKCEYGCTWQQPSSAPNYGDSTRPNGQPLAFNWMARRSPCFLVSGDKPRFGLARVFPEASACPPIAKLGDLRIRCKVGGKSFWLDDAKQIWTVFYPGGTCHNVSLKPDAPLSFRVQASMLGTQGIAVQIAVTADAPQDIELELVYGGVHQKGRPSDTASYFNPIDDPAEWQDDTAAMEPGKATLSDPKVAAKVVVLADPGAVTDTADNHAIFRYNLTADKAEKTFRLLAYQLVAGTNPDYQIDRFDQYVRETGDYYKKLLDQVEIHTPDRVLDTGFYASVVNMDYVYEAPAWLEGIHWWSAPWCNNFQISAAISLGQLDRARDALKMYAAMPIGPAGVTNADGSPSGSFEDGLPYYIQELYRYWLATGDVETLNKVWEPTVTNLGRWLEQRDPDGNKLANFHLGCNAFLYQADHLSLPGDASSPSIMIADCVDKMAEMAEARGNSAQATGWRHHADYMRTEIIRRLWQPDKGKFVGAIDTQGMPMAENYYTDFVFPELYSSMPPEYSWISLKTLDNTLWSNDHLMRVGNFKPSVFANDTVMPTQMAEAAEAYLRAGRSQAGYKLLYGTALGVTTYTDSPGSFPERMSYTGFGQPDYAFGNPTGSFVRTVISGLFGLERASADKALIWRPSIPENWKSSSLRIGDIRMSITGVHGSRTYVMLLPKAQALDFRIPLHDHAVERVRDADGRAVSYTVAAHPNGSMLRIQAKPAARHEFTVVSKPTAAWKPPTKAKSGAKVEWTLPTAGMSVVDPQQAFEQFRIDGKVLTGRLAKAIGTRTFFLRQIARGTMMPIELDFGSPANKAWKPLVLPGKREAISLKDKFNGDVIFSKNFWNYSVLTIDISKNTVRQGERSFLTVGDYRFEVLPTGQNMVLLAVGDLGADSQKLALSDKSSYLMLDVGKRVRGLEFLIASEWRIRTCGSQVGFIGLHYADGSCQTEPLVHLRNIGSAYGPFATEAEHLTVASSRNIDAFAVQADPTRKLESLEIRLYAADGNVGIFAINKVLPELPTR